MKAALLIAPQKIIISEVPDPVVGDYDAKCEILATAVCGGTDRHLFDNAAYFKVAFPVIIGHEAIGRVIECGSKVRNYQVGDLVTRVINKLPEDSGINLKWGAFAEQGIVVDWEALRDDGYSLAEWQKYTVNRVLPSNFDPVASTMIITWRETLSFLKRINHKTGEQAIIIGSGANALSFLKHNKNNGLNSIIIGNCKRSEHFLRCGAVAFLSYQSGNLLNELREHCPQGVDLIIDAIGSSKTLNQTLPLLNHFGKIGVYGLDEASNYLIDSSRMKGDYTFFDGEIYDEGLAHEEVVALVNAGKLDAWDFLARKHVYDLDHVVEALTATWEGETFKGVVRINA